MGLFRRLASLLAALAVRARRLFKSASEPNGATGGDREGGRSRDGGDWREATITPVPDEVKAQAVAHGGVSYRAPSGQSYLVIHHEGAFRVFVNRCPHRHLRLDRSGRVLRSADQRWIVCGVHGERFDPLTGQCVSARCAGKYLQPAADVVLKP